MVPGHLRSGEKHCEDNSVLLPANSRQPPLRRNSWAAKGSFQAKLGGRGRGHYSPRCVALQNRLLLHGDEQWPAASTSLSNIDAYVLAATFYPQQPKAQWEVWWEHTGP